MDFGVIWCLATEIWLFTGESGDWRFCSEVVRRFAGEVVVGEREGARV